MKHVFSHPAKVVFNVFAVIIAASIVSPALAKNHGGDFKLNLVDLNLTLDALSDGTVQFKVGNLVQWHLPTGPALYSSCRDENTKYDYFDCGDNGELYWSTEDGIPQFLSVTMEQVVSHTPYIIESGGVILGSKITTVFLIDAKSGRLVHTYDYDSPTKVYEGEPSYYMERILNDVENPFYVTRRDYSLELVAPNLSNVVWKMTLAHIEAAIVNVCPHLEFDSHLDMQLSCHSDVRVYHSYKPSTSLPLEGCNIGSV